MGCDKGSAFAKGQPVAVPVFWKLSRPILTVLVDGKYRTLVDITNALAVKYLPNIAERNVLDNKLRQACSLLAKARMIEVGKGYQIRITKRGLIALQHHVGDIDPRPIAYGRGGPGHWDPRPMKGHPTPP